MFAVEMLPAGHGDALWVEWGPPGTPWRMLIDGGTAESFPSLRAKVLSLPEARRALELLVITHVDSDHIGGVIGLLEDVGLGVSIDEVWFNGYRHLAALDGQRGVAQGERLTELLTARGLPWNRAFGGGPAVVLPDLPLPVVTLAGGMTLTLLSPVPQGLRVMREVWEKECRDAGIVPGAPRKRSVAAKRARPERVGPLDVEALALAPFDQDDSAANGSSIAFVAEYEGKRCLFGADAFPEVLMNSLARMMERAPTTPVRLDACKLPHHGSRRNVPWELLWRLDCPRWLFSTDGEVFHHPDPECVAQVVTAGGPCPVLVFNHSSDETSPWGDPAVQRERGFTAVFPSSAGDTVRVEL